MESGAAFFVKLSADHLEQRHKVYNDYLMALEQFDVEFLPETPPVCTVRLRRKLVQLMQAFILPHQPINLQQLTQLCDKESL